MDNGNYDGRLHELPQVALSKDRGCEVTAKELRELDAWIAEHVMGWQWWRFNHKGSKWCQLVPPNERWPVTKKAWRGVLCKCAIAGMEDCTDLSMFKPSSNAAAAMEVLRKCLEKTSPHPDCFGIVAAQDVVGETLELTICLFAKKLFVGAA